LLAPNGLCHPENFLGQSLYAAAVDTPVADIGIKVPGLAKTEPLDEIDVIGGIISHHHHRAGIEALHQQGVLRVGGEVGGAPNDLHASVLDPIPGGSQKLLGHGIILDDLKAAEEPGPLLLKGVVVVVNDGRDGAHRLIASLGEKEGYLCVFEEGVFMGVEERLTLPDERRNPIGIITINVPGKFNKFHDIFLTFDRFNAHL